MNRIALVTGAASGLGASLARVFLARGWRVIGVDLHAAGVDAALAHPHLTAIGVDLADADSRTRMFNELLNQLPASLDVLAHCAGTSAVGAFELQSSADVARVIATNLVAPIALTQALLNANRLAEGATVMLAASLSCYVGYPGASVYAGTKDGLAAYGRSLGVALATQGRHCVTVFPGPMRTPHARQFAPADSTAGAERARMHPDRVAAAMFNAIGTRKSRVVVGIGARLACVLGTLAPNWTTTLMARALWSKLRPPLQSAPEPRSSS